MPKETKSAGLPNITGSIDEVAIFYGNTIPPTTTGAFSATYTRKHCATSHTTYALSDYVVYFDASKSSSVFGKSSTVQPNSYTVLWIIKIAA